MCSFITLISKVHSIQVIPATNQFILRDISQLVECLNKNGHIIQVLDSVLHLLTPHVVKTERAMMFFLHRKSVLKPVYIKVINY